MTGPAPKGAAPKVTTPEATAANVTAATAAGAGPAWPAEAVTGLVNRIDWAPGCDLLRGTCHCGARHTSDDPVEMWAWLLAHPEGHRARMSDD